jgi:hypothetical protein
MKLTAEQIDYVFNYVASHDIKWYELQVELTDHMVTSMEDFWEKDPELTFHQVKHYAEDKFGRNGFKAIEKQRTQILKREHRKVQWEMITEYLKFPKIVGSILLVFLTFKVSFYFDEPRKFVAGLFGLSLILYVPAIYTYYKNWKIEGKHFLELEISNPLLLGITGFINIGIILLNIFRETFQQSPVLLLPICCLWVLGILFFFTGNHLYKKSLQKIKKQYQLT